MAQFEAKEIGARIAQARKEAGLTQEELAELAPFSTRSLQDYEQGRVIPYRQLRDIGKLLDRPVEWFLHGEGEEEPAILERLDRIEAMVSRLLVAQGLDPEAEVRAAVAAALEAETAATRLVREEPSRRDSASG